VDGTKTILCCLCAGKTENAALDHYISSHHQSVTFTTLSQNNESATSIFLSGYFDVEEEPDDLDDSLADEEERDVRFIRPDFGYPYGDQDSDDDEDDEDSDEDEDEYDYFNQGDGQEEDEEAPQLIQPHPRIEEIVEDSNEVKAKGAEGAKKRKRTKGDTSHASPSPLTQRTPPKQQKAGTNQNKKTKLGKQTNNNNKRSSQSSQEKEPSPTEKGVFFCKPCSKNFKTATALQSHKTSKHQ